MLQTFDLKLNFSTENWKFNFGYIQWPGELTSQMVHVILNFISSILTLVYKFNFDQASIGRLPA